MVDPYAKAIARTTRWHDSMFPYKMGGDDLSYDVCQLIVVFRFFGFSDKNYRKPIMHLMLLFLV